MPATGCCWASRTSTRGPGSVAAGAVVTVGTDSYWAAAPEFTRSGTKPDNQNHGIGTVIAIEGLVELGMTPA